MRRAARLQVVGYVGAEVGSVSRSAVRVCGAPAPGSVSDVPPAVEAGCPADSRSHLAARVAARHLRSAAPAPYPSRRCLAPVTARHSPPRPPHTGRPSGQEPGASGGFRTSERAPRAALTCGFSPQPTRGAHNRPCRVSDRGVSGVSRTRVTCQPITGAEVVRGVTLLAGDERSLLNTPGGDRKQCLEIGHQVRSKIPLEHRRVGMTQKGFRIRTVSSF